MTDSRFETEGGDRVGGLEYSGTVTDAFFADGEYGASLNIKTRLDNPEVYSFLQGGEHTRFIGVGRSKDGAWRPVDNGARIEFVTTEGEAVPDKKINANSQLGQLLRYFAGNDAVGKAIPASWSAKDARGWIGLWIDWRNIDQPARKQKVDANGNQTGEWYNTTEKKSMPVEVRASGAPRDNGAVSTPEPEVAPLDLATLDLTDEVLSNLRGVAMVSSNDAAFVGAALQVEGVKGNANALNAISQNTAALRKALAE